MSTSQKTSRILGLSMTSHHIKNTGRQEDVDDRVRYQVTEHVMAVGSVPLRKELQTLLWMNTTRHQCNQVQSVVFAEMMWLYYSG